MTASSTTLSAPVDEAPGSPTPRPADGLDVHFGPRLRAEGPRISSGGPADPVFELSGVDVWYGRYLAVHDVSLPVLRNSITAMIGPSGCGKSTILRSLNRMNDLVAGARVTGRVSYHG